MVRSTLSNISSEALTEMNQFHPEMVKSVSDAISKYPLVVVGMAQNPVVKQARNALKDASITYKYLEYGSYFSQWRKRLAIKLWSGWPTFPQVFVDGRLIGGAKETLAAIKAGKIKSKP